ncbi:hypothetical protein QCN29_05470 [Streptomyces sp. HNM0663]|uniref:Transmembrane protein n=1 Tax=Streptomyces chengmaiensis TaxID=3040919 RepID=A0ABT6HIW9_9ACTN|nr:hypothetical protein [Streptomyces chengmaiensis]MDH2388247.1 hypothetical protein [Streptomyces chengmaiensis]
MHMNSAGHLMAEDRAEYGRLLDEALRTARHRPEPAAKRRLTTEQLRTMALNATALITASAAAEYEHYVKVRDELRASASSASMHHSVLAPATVGEAAERGAGLGAVITVLAPVLAGAAAAIFLIVGYILKLLSPTPTFAETLLTAGWLFGALTAVGIFAAAVGLLVTALRNGPTQVSADASAAGVPDELSRARDAWREALLVRGILPFLDAALTAPGATPGTVPGQGRTPADDALEDGTPSSHRPGSRMPKIGYSGPDFTSPDFGGHDYGTPERRQD